jgi:hypothetical protein
MGAPTIVYSTLAPCPAHWIVRTVSDSPQFAALTVFPPGAAADSADQLGGCPVSKLSLHQWSCIHARPCLCSLGSHGMHGPLGPVPVLVVMMSPFWWLHLLCLERPCWDAASMQ